MNKRYVALCLATPIAIVLSVWLVAWLSPTDVPGAAQFVQAVLVGSAVVIGSVFAAARFGLFREFEPHVVVEQEVTHRAVSASYVHISCSITLRNSSKVAVWITRGTFSLQATSGLSDEDAARLYSQRWVSGQTSSFQWPVLDYYQREWGGNGLLIEPGSERQETSEFLVRHEVESTIVRSNFEGSRRGVTERRWSAAKFYDLKQIHSYAKETETCPRDHHTQLIT